MSIATATPPRGAFDSASVTAWCRTWARSVCSTWSRTGRTNSSICDDDRVGELRFADDVGEQRLRIDRVGHLPPQQAGHDLDAGERILQLVRDAGRHLAERRQPIPQPLALLELLDLRQVLEEHDRPERARRCCP